MCLKSRLVLVNLVDPNPIVVVDVLYHIKPQAPRLIMDGTTGVLNYPGDELFLVAFLDLERCNYHVHGFSASKYFPDSCRAAGRR